MAVGEALRELVRELRTQKVRTLLSLSSMVWGTLALVLLLAFACGFEALFVERTAGIGDGVAIAWAQRTTRPWRGFPAGRALAVRRADVLALPALVPELHAASAEFSLSERLRVGAQVLGATLSGVDAEYAGLRAIAPAPGGRFLGARDSEARAHVLFLGNVLARRLFADRDPIGQRVQLHGALFTVVGVLAPKEQDSDYNGQDCDRAFVPATTFLALFGDRPVSDFVFRAHAPAAQSACTAAVTAALARRLGFDPADQQALTVWDTNEQQRLLGWIFLGFQIMLGIAGAFTLLVGGLGTAHLMALLVRRRTAEIGLKLAVGALPATVRREIAVQALALVGTGAGGGLALAAAAIALVRRSPLVTEVGRPFVSPALALTTAVLLAAIGLIAGALPARRAAALDPILALRGG